ncbi:MAG TPA: hypothetical protein VFZ34_04505, partial [Blastocatellia bacterium]|nr:hypothetical protein [Blastocatellia bacterium]
GVQLMIRLFSAFCLLLSLILNVAAQTELTREQRWRADLQFLADELPKRHPNLFFKLQREAFNREVAKLNEAIARLSDDEIKTALIRLVALVGDGHTSISWAAQRFYPISFYQFGNDLYAIAAADEYQQIVGKRLVKIGETPLAKAKQPLSELVSRDNDQWLKAQLPSVLPASDVLFHLKLLPAATEGKFVFADANNKEISVTLKAVTPETKLTYSRALDPTKYPLYLQKQDQNYWYEYLRDTKTLYLNYNRCQEMKDRPFKAFAEEVLAFVEANPIERFVIDLRRNGGGNEAVFFPLLLKLPKHPTLNQKGKLFVVIGRRTFSSGFGNARTLKSITQAILIGEPTGQKPNAYGEVRSFQLPHSKLTVNHSTKFWKRMEGDPQSLAPDIVIEPTFADYAAGRDPVLDAIEKYQSK